MTNPLDYDARSVESGSVHVQLECHYLIEPPRNIAANPLLVLCTHGYGMNARVMLNLAQIWYHGRHWLASAEGPHGYYLGERPGEGGEAFNWGTISRRSGSIRTHHEIIEGVIEAAMRRTGIPRERVLLLGFSQSVGMNYQLASRRPGIVGGIIGLCGSPPRDWEVNPEYGPVDIPVLHIARSEDEYYTPEVQAALPGRLRTHLNQMAFHLLPGRHRFPSGARDLVADWERRHFGV